MKKTGERRLFWGAVKYQVYSIIIFALFFIVALRADAYQNSLPNVEQDRLSAWGNGRSGEWLPTPTIPVAKKTHTDEPLSQDPDTFIPELMELYRIPGVAACIVNDSEVVWSG
ncbi:hypothetical protein ACFLQW_03990, partial [Candidatus Zixiibacteriota bacterium]